MSARAALERISEIDRLLDDLAAQQKVLTNERNHLERVACDEICSFDSTAKVAAGGRTYWVEDAHRVSCNKENREAVLEAAEQVGIADEITTVATTTLKSWLVSRAKELGIKGSITEGTPFDGIVSVYVEQKIRHRTCN
jgi:hypothetical protein